ncbi:MAG: hypothetical protein AAFV69_08595 [Pseudomonadota bacterium]
MFSIDWIPYVTGVAALVILGVAIWAIVSSSARLTGALAIVAALVVLGSSFLMWQFIDGSDVGGDRARLTMAQEELRREKNNHASTRERYEETDRDNGRLQRERTALVEDMARLKRERSDLSDRLSQAERSRDNAKSDLGRLQREYDSKAKVEARRLDLIADHVRRVQDDVGLESMPWDPPLGHSDAENRKRFDDITSEVRRFTNLRREPQRVARRDANLEKLKSKLAYGVETDDYTVEVFPDNELVRGQRGSYYAIDLKNADTGVKFGFEAGRYTLDRSQREFRASLNAFMRDVLTKLDGKARYRLLVRGSADVSRFNGRQDTENTFNRVTYMREVGDGRYTNETKTRQLTTRITNDDLPFLRAKFLKELINDVYPQKRPDVLEGVVTDKVSQLDRNAEILLFVGW